VRRPKHGARSAKQAIAIGLSKARRAGVKLGKPKSGSVSARTCQSIEARHGSREAAEEGTTLTHTRSRHDEGPAS
jgi:hypothetical protein